MLSTAAALGLLVALSGPPAVTVLPLTPAKGLSKKQAKGIDALLRERLDESDFIKPLPAQKQDRREAFRCGTDPGCLTRLAYARGADLLAAGVISETDEGFRVRLVVVEPGDKGVLRDVEEPVIGTRDDMRYWLDRLLRRAFKPEALAGGIYVVGEPAGARVLVDGAVAGTLPFEDALEGVVEGEHTLDIEHPGYVSMKRRVDVRFREVTRVEVILRAERPTPGATEVRTVEPLSTGVLGGPWAGIGTGAVGVLALAGGATFGTLALLDQLEVEQRAQQQQLFLPRDEGLLSRGDAFAWTANGLYALSALALAGGAALFVTDLVTVPPATEDRSFAAPTQGAPEADEMRPRLLE